MSDPAYQLRPNKAVDRFVMLELIRRLGKIETLSDYTYYSLGGPYLEDFRVLYEIHDEIGMVSLESKERVFKRQQFHLPCSTLVLKHKDIHQFIDEYESDGRKSIFWLDYTKLKYSYFEYFALLLEKVTEGSVVKITLRAEAMDWQRSPELFAEEFRTIMPDPDAFPSSMVEEYSKLLQDMIRITSQRAFPGQLPFTFVPITSFYYSDGVGMFTPDRNHILEIRTG